MCDCFLLYQLYGLVSILKVKMIFINKYENMQDIGKSPFITSFKIFMYNWIKKRKKGEKKIWKISPAGIRTHDPQD